MAETDGVVRLEKSKVRKAAEVLARAFHDDPFYRTLLPDEVSRPKRLAWFMERMLRYGLGYGHVYTTPAVEGVACWFPPGHLSPGVGDILRSGLYALPLRLGLRAYRCMTAFTSYVDPIRHRCLPEAHWYLLLLGVDRPCQGKGLAGRLLQPILSRADNEGVACYLETENEGNVRFYARYGFTLAEAGREPRYGVRMWCVLRPGFNSASGC
jgi:ribosomal protein S18 acetylase RimI-like enzyme